MHAETGKSSPVFSWAEIHRRIDEGSLWIIVKDTVYDISDFKRKHPGGESVLESVVGLQCDDYVFGVRALQFVTSVGTRSKVNIAGKKFRMVKYRHSRVALSELDDLVVGRIQAGTLHFLRL